MPKSFIELEIVADDELSEQLIAILSQLGFEGYWEDVEALRCYIAKDRWDDGLLDEVTSVATTLQRSISSQAPKITLKAVEDKNWNEEWEKTIRPIHVTDRIVITPTWHNYQALPDELVLTIDPKMSFGTGYHETTRLVLRLMEKHLKPGSKLLDLGTGTGVLAIAGIKLGAASAIGVDNDEWSYDNAIENLQLNHVQEKAKIILGELRDVKDSGFDLIVANVQRNVIEPMLLEMKSRLRPNGIVLLSGLLNVDEEPMRSAIRGSGFGVREMLKENEWIALCIEA